MNTSYVTDMDQNYSECYPLTYTHSDGQQTQYDLQEIRYADGRPPVYVISESEHNQGPGFDNAQTRYGVSQDAATAAIALNDPQVFLDAEKEVRPREVNLYQQRPDGDFDQIRFREIGQTARPNVDVEMEQNDLKLYQSLQQSQEPTPAHSIPFSESTRTLYSREDVEKAVEEPLHAKEQSPQQQYQEVLNDQWRDLSGPTIDRGGDRAATEQQAAAVQQRSAEQNQQMNEHVQQQTR